MFGSRDDAGSVPALGQMARELVEGCREQEMTASQFTQESSTAEVSFPAVWEVDDDQLRHFPGAIESIVTGTPIFIYIGVATGPLVMLRHAVTFPRERATSDRPRPRDDVRLASAQRRAMPSCAR